MKARSMWRLPITGAVPRSQAPPGNALLARLCLAVSPAALMHRRHDGQAEPAGSAFPGGAWERARARRQTIFALAALLGLHVGLVAWGAWQHSPAWDEVSHMGAALSHWRLWQFDAYRVNPPLVRMVAVVPLIVCGADAGVRREAFSSDPRQRPENALGHQCVIAWGPRTFWWFTVARWTCIPFSLLGAWICFRWARDLYGERSGLMAAALWCFCPTLTGNAELMTPDLGGVALGLAAAYTFWRWLKTPDWGRAIAAGIAMGAAELAKTTWVVLYLLWPLLWVVWKAVARRPAAPQDLGTEKIVSGTLRVPLASGTRSVPDTLESERPAHGCHGQLAARAEETLVGKPPPAPGTVCHSERSEESAQFTEILRFAQDDTAKLPCCKTIGTGHTLAGEPPVAPGDGLAIRPTIRRPVGRELAMLAGILALAIYLVNLGYGFEGSFTRLGDFKFISRFLTDQPAGRPVSERLGNRFTGSWLGYVPVPFPANYVQGIDVQRHDFDNKMWSYLRGEWRLGGWWYYYLYALAIKVPLGTWALVLLAAGVSLLCRGYSSSRRDELTLLTPAVVVLALVSSQTGFNHHVRYVLPVLPFTFIWVSKLASAMHHGHRLLAFAASAALTWSVASSLWIYPHSLSYFNEIVGGPMGAPAHLTDSNIDWGQDLLYLRSWLAGHPEAQPVGLAHMLPKWLMDPKEVGIRCTDPPPGAETEPPGKPPSANECGPLPGWYAISVYRLLYHDWRYRYFRQFRPVATAGYSIYIYHITRDEADRARAEAGLPPVPADDTPRKRGSY